MIASTEISGIIYGMTITEQTNRTVDQILATMTDDEIADLTDEQIKALATGVGLIVVPD